MERFACPSEPGSYVIWGYVPLEGSKKTPYRTKKRSETLLEETWHPHLEPDLDGGPINEFLAIDYCLSPIIGFPC